MSKSSEHQKVEIIPEMYIAIKDEISIVYRPIKVKSLVSAGMFVIGIWESLMLA
jgi:hypothetical protein